MDTLLEMGFPKNRAEKALAITGNKGAEAAMEWLLQHSEDPDIDDPLPEGGPEVAAAAGEGEPPQRVLTEEEKAAKAKELGEKIKQRRKEREEQEKKEAIEKEKRRMESGKQIVDAKRRMDELEMKKIAEERRREKIEDRLARERVKKQIEADKIARRQKFNMEGAAEAAPPAPAAAPAPAHAPAAEAAPKKEYSMTRLQIRLTDGAALTSQFGAKEALAAVRLYVEMNRTDGQGAFTLGTAFPRRVFTEEDYERPLDSLGLVPSAVLIMSKPLS